jgi:hypothetical protein
MLVTKFNFRQHNEIFNFSKMGTLHSANSFVLVPSCEFLCVSSSMIVPSCQFLHASCSASYSASCSANCNTSYSDNTSCITNCGECFYEVLGLIYGYPSVP